jgi:hypothetical protein
MLHKPIHAITEADLQSLVNEGRREDGQLEFKQALPGNNDDGKKEFLKDVTAMANTSGGDIIYGIREDRSTPDEAGKAAEVVAITGLGVDAVKLWMSELLHSSVEERMFGIVIHDVPIAAGGFALVVRVPKSWNSPHVVRHKNHWRFYARNSAGVYAMNVTELRAAFLLSDTLTQRLDEFRRDRLYKITGNTYPALKTDADWSRVKASDRSHTRTSALVIHLQPFDSVRPGYVVDIAQALSLDEDRLSLCGDDYGEPSIRLNFDGVRVSNANGYFQLYRAGVIEEVNVGELTSDLDGNTFDEHCIGATELDRAIFKGVGRRLALLKRLGVTSPVLVSLALLNVRSCKLLLRQLYYVGGNPSGVQYKLSEHAIDRHDLMLSGIIIENLQELPLEGRAGGTDERDYKNWRTAQGLMRPYCDSIWNAVGFLRSRYFDSEGRWIGAIGKESVR